MSSDWVEKYIEIINKVDFKNHKVSTKISFASIANNSTLNLGVLYFYQYVNIYPKYLELTKIQRLMLKEKIAEVSNLKIVTIDKRFSMLNTAFKNGLDLSQFKSFNQIEKVIKTPKKTLKLPTKNTVTWTTDEKEINSIIANQVFQSFRREFDANRWKLANVLKALKK